MYIFLHTHTRVKEYCAILPFKGCHIYTGKEPLRSRDFMAEQIPEGFLDSVCFLIACAKKGTSDTCLTSIFP